MYISLKRGIDQAKEGRREYLYHAPTFIVVTNLKENRNALADSACVLQNMMLAAHALELGACWINTLHWMDANATLRSFLQELGMGADETITGGLIVGFPKNPPARTVKIVGNPVIYHE
jgi:nitroreductase